MDVMLRRRSPASLLRRRCTRYYSSFAVPLTLDNKIKKYDTDTYLTTDWRRPVPARRSGLWKDVFGQRFCEGAHAAEGADVYHVDLYRLDGMTEQDVAAVGLAEAFERGITLIEWPERLNEASVPAERLEVRISYVDGNTDIRRVELQPIGERWTKLFATSIE
ncbi:unnamed protein product [Peronospora belbahrii]|uniref:tRNA threonylcarbamoyladenosine biosynthesis protein TsaE n=1 Tax=Peronospora belbahrii TaxID=622444 RepID=A0ABN8D5U3_9STRA|nr:unnamed protein product [Peronospora belbahrii]